MLDIVNQIGLDIVIYALGGTILIVILFFILLIVCMVKIKNLKKKYNSFMDGEDGKSLEKKVLEQFSEVDQMKERMFEIDKHLKKTDEFLLNTYNKMSVVKYNAFQEMGGNLSFVIAMLNERNDGYIMNAMHSSREGCYTYVKTVKNGTSDAPLSEEEKQALESAIGNRG